MNYELLIGLRYTRAQPREGVANRFISFIALISMLGLALGVAALIVVLSVMNGFQKELRERILGAVVRPRSAAGACCARVWCRAARTPAPATPPVMLRSARPPAPTRQRRTPTAGSTRGCASHPSVEGPAFVTCTAHFLKSVCFEIGHIASSVTVLMNTCSSNHGT